MVRFLRRLSSPSNSVAPAARASVRRTFWVAGFLLFNSVVMAHMVSMSTGTLRVEGASAEYELRMPLYEAEALENPRTAFFDNFQVSSDGSPVSPSQVACRAETADDLYVCHATYEFPEAVGALEVRCTYYAVTVPNHVHILRAQRGDLVEQVIFDLASPSAEINFIPPSAWDIARDQVVSGVRRAAGGLASVLFLVALVIAGRSRRELAALVGMFVAGQAVACLLLPVSGWNPPPRFVEAAAALTIAYLAVEILLLPAAGQRWAVVGVLGAFHGLYLAMFISTTGFFAHYVLTGAALTDLLLIAVLALVWRKVTRGFGVVQPTRIVAGLLFLFGLGWFFLRIRG